MPWARARSCWTASPMSRASWSSSSREPSGSLSASWRARRRLTASATRCCCAPSWRSRSILRRAASAAATMRALEACSSDAWWRTWSRLSWRAESSSTLCRARPTWRPSSVIIVSSSTLNWSASGGRTATRSPSTWPEWVAEATRTTACSRPARSVGSQICTQAVPDGAGPGHYRLLLLGQLQLDDGGVGDRHRALEVPLRAGPHLRRRQPQRLAQRLGHLQEQLFHRHGAARAGCRRCAARCRGPPARRRRRGWRRGRGAGASPGTRGPRWRPPPWTAR